MYVEVVVKMKMKVVVVVAVVVVKVVTVEYRVSVQVVVVPSCVQEKSRRRCRQVVVRQVAVVDVEFALRLVELAFVVVLLLLMVTAKWPGQ